MRMLLIGRGKMGTLIQQTAQAAGDEVVAALGREDLGKLASMDGVDVDALIAALSDELPGALAELKDRVSVPYEG